MIPISATFIHNDGLASVQILAAILVIAMTATTFTTQRQLMSKNMPADAMSGPYAQQQKMLLYVLPVVVRRRWYRVPDRRPRLLDDLQPLDDGPAVLRDPPQPGTRHAGVRRQGRPRPGQGAYHRAASRSWPWRRRTTPRSLRSSGGEQQPKKQSREQRKKRSGPRPNGQAGQKPAPQADGPEGESADDTDDNDEGKTA